MKTLLKTAFLLAAGTLVVHATNITDWSEFKTNLSSSTACDLVITQSFTGTTDVGVIASAQANTITSADAENPVTISNSNTILGVPAYSLKISNINFSSFTNSLTTETVPASNTDYVNGGVIVNSVTLEIDSVKFSNNSVTNGNGGVIANMTHLSSLTISDSEFSGNSASNYYGGAIYNSSTSSGEKIATISSITGTKADDAGTIFSKNSAKYGGAIYNAGAIGTISGVSFKENSATTYGGAIYNDATGTIAKISGTFTSNGSSTADGGAIYNEKGGTISLIENATFDSNISDNGGAIYNRGGTIEAITGTTFKNNSASGYGGGAIYNTKSGIIKSISATFENNTTGGAIYNLGTITIVGGTTFTGNSYAIRNYGTVYLSPEDEKTITINDAIRGSTSVSEAVGTIEIGILTGTDSDGNAIYAETAGTVILNNSLSGNTVNVRAGTLEVAEKASFADNSYTQVNIWGGGKVSLCNDFTLNRFYLDGGEITGTTYTIGTTNVTLASGMISGTTVNVSGISTEESKAGELTLAATTVNSSGNINFAGTLNLTGTLNFTSTDAENSTLTAGTFNPTGNAKIVGGTLNSLSLASGQTLAIQNTMISGSVTNAGTLTLLDGSYSNQIENTGTLNLQAGANDTIALTGAVTGEFSTSKININGDATGTVTINVGVSANTICVHSGTLVLGDSFIAQNSTRFYLYGGAISSSSASFLSSVYLQDNASATLKNLKFVSTFSTNNLTSVGTNVSLILENVTADLEFGGNMINHNGSMNLSIINAKIENNTSNKTGGAIKIESGHTISTLTGTFTGNSAESSGGSVIYNEGTIGELAGTFTGNSASGNGGAIYNSGTITIVANSTISTSFSGDKVGETLNAIHNTGTLNLQASGNGEIVFNDAISGSTGTINISNSGAGTVVFNAEVSGNTVNLKSGTLILGDAGTLENGVTMFAGTELVKNSATNGSVALTVASAAITVNKIEAFVSSEEVVVTSTDGVKMELITAWTFGVENDGNEVTVSMDVGKEPSLTADNFVIFHLADDAQTWQDYSSQISDKTYDSATGTLSFKTTSFCSYGIAVIPEPSMFGVIAGTLALLLAGTRRRRGNAKKL